MRHAAATAHASDGSVALSLSDPFCVERHQREFLDLLLEVGVGRIMFSVDYPHGSMAEARAFLDHIPVSAADRERIAHGNAERLFNL